MSRPADAKYSETHEWVKIKGDIATLGITDFAVQQLNDLTFIDLPDVGDAVEKGASFGEIESVKAVSDLYSHVTGEIIEVNKSVDEDEFKALKEDAFGKGWLIKVKVGNPKDADDLMDITTYERQLAAENH